MKVIDRYEFNPDRYLCSGGGSGDGGPGDGGGFGGGGVGTGGAAGTGVGGLDGGGFNGGPGAFGASIDPTAFTGVPPSARPAHVNAALGKKGSIKGALDQANKLSALGLNPGMALAIGIASEFGDGIFGADFSDSEAGGQVFGNSELGNQLSRVLRGHTPNQDLGGGENGQGIFFRNQSNAQANGAGSFQNQIGQYYAQNPYLAPKPNAFKSQRDVDQPRQTKPSAFNAFRDTVNSDPRAVAVSKQSIPAAYRGRLEASGINKASPTVAKALTRQNRADRMRTQDGGR